MIRIIFAFLSVFILNLRIDQLTNYLSIEYLLMIIKSIDIFDALFIIIVSFLIIPSSKYNIKTIVFSILLSLMIMVGKIFGGYNSLELFFSQSSNWFIFTLGLVGHTYIFNSGLNWFLQFPFDRAYKIKVIDKINYLFSRYTFTFSFSFLLIMGIPIMISFYPGTVHWDGLAQLNSFFGFNVWDNHYPAISTIIMGLPMSFGHSIGNDNFGIFLYTFPQFILSSAILAYAIKSEEKFNVPLYFQWLTLFFFAFLPIWPLYAFTFIKDTYYYLFFLVFVIELLNLCFMEEKNLLSWIRLVGSMTLVWVFRNDGFYIILFVLFFFAILGSRYLKLKYSLLLIAYILLIQVIFHSIFLPSLGILEGSPREMLSIPIQQTGRYVKEYASTLSFNERGVIESVFTIEIDEISKSYDPEYADPIKNKFVYNPTRNQLVSYFQTWGYQFLKHPFTYFEATLNTIYGYFDPLKREIKDGPAWFTIQYSPYVFTEDFDLHFIPLFEPFRAFIEMVTYTLRNQPVIGLFFNTGTYTWITLVNIFYLYYHKRYQFIVFYTPIIATIGMTLLSPVNAYIRYYLPIMVTFPIMTAFTLYYSKNKVV